MSEPRKPVRSWNSPARGGRRRSTGGLLLRLSLGVGFLVCAVGAALIFSGRASRPVFQSFQAVFPEGLLGPGDSKLLVRLEDPFTHAPLSGTVHVFLQDRDRNRYDLGSAPVKGTGLVPFSLPNVGIGGLGLGARVEGALEPAEVSVQNVDVDMGDKVGVCTEKYLYYPGERVHFLGIARHNDTPPRPAAGEPWTLRVSSPAGDPLLTLMGTTSPGGTFEGSFQVPFSARPGFYAMDVQVGRDILGYTEIKVPMEKDSFRIRPLLLHRAVAGAPFQGRMEISFLDGTPYSGAKVRVVLVKRGKDLEDAPCVLAGPGIYAFTMDLPPLEKGADEPLPLDLEARIIPPEGGDEARFPFDKIFLYRSPYRILLECPHRWVPGMPHRVRAALVGREDQPVPAQLRVLAGEGGPVLAEASFPGKGSAVLDFTFPKKGRSLLFVALDPGGKRVLSRRKVHCRLPENQDQDFTVILEKSVLSPGDPLRLTVFDGRKKDRLWVDLLVEGMVADVFSLDVKDGKGVLEVPFSKLPLAFFQVRVWRWEGNPPPMHQAACLALGEASRVARAKLLPAGEGVKVETGLPGDGDLLFSGRPGRLDPYDLPGPESITLGLLPGVFGFADVDAHRLAQAWRDGTPLPEQREDLAPTIKDSWIEGNGPGRLVESRMEVELGKVVLLIGVVATLLGLALSWWAFSKEKAARMRRNARLTGLLLFFLLPLGALRAQQPQAAQATDQADQVQGRETPSPDILPNRLPPWAWRRVPPSQGPLGPFLPNLPGKQALSLAGQTPGKGGILLSWGQESWSPLLDLRWPSSGAIWPGAEWKLPVWARTSRSSPRVFRPFFGKSSLPAGEAVKFRGKGIWHRMVLSFTYRDVLGGGRLEIRDGAGHSLLETSFPYSSPPKEVMGVSWSAPFGEGLKKKLVFGPGNPEISRLQVLAFADPVAMALKHLDETRGDPLVVGSLDQVLGRARTALAVLRVLLGSGSFPAERRKASAVKALDHLMEAWRELAGFRNVIGGYAEFPRATDEISPTAEALAFLGEAQAYLPSRVAGVIRRVRRWLWRKVRDDGRVLPDPGYLSEEIWKESGGGRLFITSQVERALAATKAEVYYLKRTEDVIRVDLGGNPPPLVRIEAARALLARDPRNPAGLAILKKCKSLAGDRTTGVRAGFTDWTGAEGDRADLVASAHLACALARAGLEKETAAMLRSYILDRIRPDLGFGDEWTTGACYEALLAAPESARPGGEMDLRVLADGKTAAARKGGPFLVVDLPSAPGAEGAEIRVETGGEAPLGAVILRGRRLEEPGRARKEGSLILRLEVKPGAAPALEKPLPCVLSVGNSFSRSMGQMVLRIPRVGGASLLPGGLLYALEQGEASRVYMGRKETLVWFSDLPGVYTKRINLVFLPHAWGKIHLPPLELHAVFQEDIRARTAPVEVKVGS